MEPPVKRRRLDEPPQTWDDHEDEEDEEWEEYDGNEDAVVDNDGEEPSHERQEGSVKEDNGCQLAIEKAYADSRFRATMAHILQKYDRDFEGIGDEIDLDTGEIVVDNGHIKNMRNEVDIGVPSEYPREDDEGEELHGLADGMGGRTNAGNEIEETSEAMQDQILRMMQDDQELINEYDGPVPDGPSLISGLYDGGGLRYASAMGGFGASPFVPSPWDILPQEKERFDFLRRDGFGSIWAADYDSEDNEDEYRASSTRERSGLSRPKERGKKKSKGYPPARTPKKTTRSRQTTKKRAESVPKIRHTEHSDLSIFQRGQNETDNEEEVHSKKPVALKPPRQALEESDTIEDPVFSTEEPGMSSETGIMTDEVPQPKPASSAAPNSKVIPDSQDTCASQESPPAESPSKAEHPPCQHQTFKQNFDSACMLSDDESPLYSAYLGPSSKDCDKKIKGSSSKAQVALAASASTDNNIVKRKRGRPRKHPLPVTSGAYAPEATANKPNPTQSQPPEILAQVISQPTAGSMPPQAFQSQLIRSEVSQAPGVKRKRGRPRKIPLPDPTVQESVSQPAIQQPFLHAIPQSNLQQFSELVQQSTPSAQQHFIQFPQQLPYGTVQQSIIQQPFDPLMHQPSWPFRPSVPAAPTQPVKRKRGRPRKYPVGYTRNLKSRKLYRELHSNLHMPGLRNSMTALLGTNPTRTPVPEDPWYGVARRLALDITSLQGGVLFRGGVQYQTQVLASTNKNSHTSSQELRGSVLSVSASENNSGLIEMARITELSEADKVEIAPDESYTAPVDDEADALTTSPHVHAPDDIGMNTATREGDGQDLAVPDNDCGLTIEDSARIVAGGHQRDCTSPESPQSDNYESLTSPDFDTVVSEHQNVPIDPALAPWKSTGDLEHQIDHNQEVVKQQDDSHVPVDPALELWQPANDMEPSVDIGKGTVGDGQDSLILVDPALEFCGPADDAVPFIDKDQETVGTSKDSPIPIDPALMLMEETDNFQQHDDGPEMVDQRTCLIELSSNGNDAQSVVDESPEPPRLTGGSESQAFYQPPDLEPPLKENGEQQRPDTLSEDERGELEKRNLWKKQTERVKTDQLQIQAVPVAVMAPSRDQMPCKTPDQKIVTEQLRTTPKKSYDGRLPHVPRSVERCTPVFANITTPHPLRLPLARAKHSETQPIKESERSLFVDTPGFGLSSSLSSHEKSAEGSLFVEAEESSPPGVFGLEQRHSTKECTKELEGYLFSRAAEPVEPVPLTPSDSKEKEAVKKDKITAWAQPPNKEQRTALPEAAQRTKTFGHQVVRPSEPSHGKTASMSRSIERRHSLTSSGASRLTPPQHKISSVVKRTGSRRSILSLVSSDANSKDMEDDVDELGDPLKTNSSNSTKSARQFMSSKSARESTQKISRPSPPATEDAKKTKENRTKGIKKRRHTSASASQRGEIVCGVDGYTCNKDFCFTCL